jgi:hypothetical protein
MKKAVISDRMNIGHNLLASSSLGILAVNANQYLMNIVSLLTLSGIYCQRIRPRANCGSAPSNVE